MKRELETLHNQVFGVAVKFSDAKKRRELEEVFVVLGKEFQRQQVASQRVMALMRLILIHQPGSSKAVNEFLRSPKVASLLHQGGGYNLG